MRGDISLIDEAESDHVTFDSHAEIYRIDDGSHRVVANTDEGEKPLGVADVTVSRKQGGKAPIEFVVEQDGIVIHNYRNQNAVDVVSMVSGQRREIEAGTATTVDQNSSVEIGHHTRLLLTVERERREAAHDEGGRGDAPTRQPIEQRPTKFVPMEENEPSVLETIAERPAAHEDADDLAALSRDAIEEAETLVAECLPSGPAANALAAARTHRENGNYDRAIERSIHVRDLAEHEVAHLETNLDPGQETDADLAGLRDRTVEYDLDVDVVVAYEDLTGATDTLAADRLHGEGPPTTVPSAPDLSLTYDDIAKGRHVGTGGSAEVFEATVDTADGEFTIALKEPRFETDVAPAVIDEFEREADTWDRLDAHDNIVGVIDWGTEPHSWIAMEYMDGGPLATMAGRIAPRQAIWTLLAVVQGVYYAHQRGVAHLDLKPGNVLVRTTGEATWPVPKVGDWGLAKVLLDHTRSVKGYTPLYAAPEQIDSQRFGSPDTQTDIYQLGAIGYTLVAGRPPFTGDSAEIVYDIVDTDVPPLTDHAPGAPTRLDEILRTALAKDGTDRYENILYLRDDLRELYDSL